MNGLLKDILNYLKNGEAIRNFAGDVPRCECCGSARGKHKVNCELENLIKRIEVELKGE